MTCVCFVVYAYHFVWAMAGVDKYAHYTRVVSCGGNAAGADAEGVYDGVIFCMTLFHIIEWARQTIFLITCLIGTDMIKLFYFMSFNIPFGFGISIVAVITGFTSDADCQEKQSSRANYL